MASSSFEDNNGRDGKDMDRSERAACRYLTNQGVNHWAIGKLFHKGPQAIRNAINNETMKGDMKDLGSDEPHVPEELKRRTGESLRDFWDRIEKLAEVAFEEGRRAKAIRLSLQPIRPESAGQSKMDFAHTKRSPITPGQPVSASQNAVASGSGSRGLPTPRRHTPSAAQSANDNNSDNSDIVSLPRRPQRQAAKRAEALTKQQAAQFEMLGLTDSAVVDLSVAPDSDDESVTSDQHVTPSKRVRQSEEDVIALEPDPKSARTALKASPSHGFARRPVPQSSMYANAAAYASPPLSPSIGRSSSGDFLATSSWHASGTGPSRLHQREDTLKNLSNARGPPTRTTVAGYPEAAPPGTSSKATKARPAMSTPVEESILPWLASLKLDHRVTLLQEFGCATMRDVKDAASWGEQTRSRMFASLEENGMSKFETLRLQDGMDRLKGMS